jgi:hypothetical protein
MEPPKELIEELYRDDVEHARRMRPEDKLIAGAELFDYACSITMAGIRHQNPGADEATVRRLLRERIALGKKLEARL